MRFLDSGIPNSIVPSVPCSGCSFSGYASGGGVSAAATGGIACLADWRDPSPNVTVSYQMSLCVSLLAGTVSA